MCTIICPVRHIYPSESIYIVAIRGGTDGARLSYEGLPCPNLSTGGLNFHSIHEFIPVRSLEKMVEVLRNLVTL